ncbi:MAG: peptide-methionine (S)-S-oxide reductase MsrA [Pontibacterium sp.]
MAWATFGAGCFWGIELTFSQVRGVISTAVGYMGGSTEEPNYQQVCTGRTYHAEVVHVEYDDTVLDYESLLNTFWQCHNPTTLNRQGPDIGTQYRSVIFTHNDEQASLAQKSKAALDASGVFDQPIVTLIEPVQTFWRAEEYHQKYLEKRGMGSCHL